MIALEVVLGGGGGLDNNHITTQATLSQSRPMDGGGGYGRL